MTPVDDGAQVLVVVRTKNRPLFLGRALDDIFNQRFTDVAVVVVNDGGDPDPVDLLVEARPEHERSLVTVIHNDESVGMEAASNIGVNAASSRYIAVHDDDDLWDPNFLAETVAYLEEPAHADDGGVMVRTEIIFEEVRGDEIVHVRSEPFQAEISQITLLDMLRTNRAVPISFLYRRSVHDHIGFYNEDLPVVGDWEFHLRFLLHSTIGFIDGRPLAFWSHRPSADGHEANSIFEQLNEHRRWDTRIRDTLLRTDLSRGGLGTMLYLTSLLAHQEELAHAQQQRLDAVVGKLDEVSQRIGALDEAVHRRTSFLDLVKRPARAAARLIRR